MFNKPMLENMMWTALSQQYNQLPEPAKQALAQLQVDIVKDPDKLLILVKSESQGEQVKKAGGVLIDQLYNFLPEYLNKSFKVRVSTYG
ncbi:MAG TPA: hypothetical protein DIT43_04450 [Dehalococcoidia bacterium]|nr:hypothetical protein [Dehalococcoidia bacterium]